MQNLTFNAGLKRHLPVFLQQVEQVFGLEAGTFANHMPTFNGLDDMPTFEALLVRSPILQMVQPQLRIQPSPDGESLRGLELVLIVSGYKFLSMVVFDDEGYTLRGHGFRLHSADEAKIVYNPEAMVDAYLDEPLSRLRLVLQRAVAGFPVAALAVAQQVQAEMMTLLGQYEEALASTMDQMRGNALRQCRVSAELMADLPGFLSLVDKGLAAMNIDLRPSLVQRWEARLTSVGAENIRASDVEALFNVPHVPLMMYAGIDEETREMHYIWVPFTLSNQSVIHLEVGGERGRACLVFDFASLVVGAEDGATNRFDPEAFCKFERSIDGDDALAAYRNLIVEMLEAFASLCKGDVLTERTRRRTLMFIRGPQLEALTQ